MRPVFFGTAAHGETVETNPILKELEQQSNLAAHKSVLAHDLELMRAQLKEAEQQQGGTEWKDTELTITIRLEPDPRQLGMDLTLGGTDDCPK